MLALREKQKRNMLATLLLSQGTPMLLGGDEFGRTQQGNNNAYCQDNELTWVDWNLDADRRTLLQFVSKLVQLRLSQPAFQSSCVISRPAALSQTTSLMSSCASCAPVRKRLRRRIG